MNERIPRTVPPGPVSPDDVEINDADRAKISHRNARQLLKLG
jgi:hypothetical protein